MFATENTFEWRVDVRWPKWFIPRFAAVFLPVFAVVVWLSTPDPERIFFVLFGPFSGASAAALIYWLFDRHEKAGNYLCIDRSSRTLTLPRQHKTFGLDDIANFQWIKGREKQRAVGSVDFHLLAKDSSGVLYRYHIMGAPARAMVEQLVEFSGIPVHEYLLGSDRCRDSDIHG
ncbi:MAG: hypothetical protein AABP62_30865 [Planctomycetota bacterium]